MSNNKHTQVVDFSNSNADKITSALTNSMSNNKQIENGQPLTYWGGLADEAFEKESAINKLAEEVYGKGVKEDYEEGYIDGYNKAKKTLYTKEQLMDAIRMARQINYLNQDYEIITSIKLK